VTSVPCMCFLAAYARVYPDPWQPLRSVAWGASVVAIVTLMVAGI
jgi:uncharacterized MAPEG superfamily protein